MPACTFFGHRDCLTDIIPQLRRTILELIEQENVDLFYVGNQGFFDMYAETLLREISQQHPQIRYFVVLAYLPFSTDTIIAPEPYTTIFPQGIEHVPKKFAIFYRNGWMLERSDYIVTYVTRPFGGAAKFREMAYKKAKNVIDLKKTLRCFGTMRISSSTVYLKIWYSHRISITKRR